MIGPPLAASLGALYINVSAKTRRKMSRYECGADPGAPPDEGLALAYRSNSQPQRIQRVISPFDYRLYCEIRDATYSEEAGVNSVAVNELTLMGLYQNLFESQTPFYRCLAHPLVAETDLKKDMTEYIESLKKIVGKYAEKLKRKLLSVNSLPVSC